MLQGDPKAHYHLASLSSIFSGVLLSSLRATYVRLSASVVHFQSLHMKKNIRMIRAQLVVKLTFVSTPVVFVARIFERLSLSTGMVCTTIEGVQG